MDTPRVPDAPAGPPWTLVQFLSEGRPARGVLADQDGGAILLALPEGLPGSDLLDLLAEWRTVAPILQEFSPANADRMPDLPLTAPLTYPGAILGAGANYYGHCAEMGVDVPDPQSDPFFFVKPPRTTVIGPTDPVPYPADPGTKLDWEAELGVVIGITARDVPRESALEYVAGYVTVNDISDRSRTARDSAVSPHFVYDWLGHKGQDGFCPIGPGLTPAWLVPDPQRLRIQLSVNGEPKQDASTDDMVIDVAGLVAGASRVMTLRPGDLILSGTPAGVGAPRGDFLKPGDTVSVSVEGVGTIENPVVSR